MQVQNGLYAARKTDAGMKGIFIDEELLELGKLNQSIKANCRSREQAEAAREEAGREAQRRIRKEQRRKQRMTADIIKKELKLLGMAAVVALGQQLGMVDWAWAAPVLLGIQTVICFRAGKYFGRKSK